MRHWPLAVCIARDRRHPTPTRPCCRTRWLACPVVVVLATPRRSPFFCLPRLRPAARAGPSTPPPLRGDPAAPPDYARSRRRWPRRWLLCIAPTSRPPGPNTAPCPPPPAPRPPPPAPPPPLLAFFSHPPTHSFPGTADAINFSSRPVYIITTKQTRFALALLAAAGVSAAKVPPERVFGHGSGSKIATLNKILAMPENAGCHIQYVGGAFG